MKQIPTQNDLDAIELPPESVQFTNVAQEIYLDENQAAQKSAPHSSPEHSSGYASQEKLDNDIYSIQLSPSALNIEDLNLYLEERESPENEPKPSKNGNKNAKNFFSDPMVELHKAMEKTVLKHPSEDEFCRDFQTYCQSSEEVSKEFFTHLHTLVLQRMMTFVHNIKSFNL